MNLYLVDTDKKRHHFKANHVEIREGELNFRDINGVLIKSFVITESLYFDDIGKYIPFSNDSQALK